MLSRPERPPLPAALRPIAVVFAAMIFLSVNALAAAQVRVVAPDRFAIDADGHRLSLPFYSSRPIDPDDHAVERALVVIHGTRRNADEYHAWGTRAAGAAGMLPSTIVVTPQFLMEIDVNEHAPGDDVLFWTNNGWKQGDRSRSTEDNSRPARISSYEAMDALLTRLADTFPNLERIVIAGHSAGGQYVNRYAAGNLTEPDLRTASTGEPISVRYVVSNPSSYVYLCEKRPDGGGGFSVPDDQARRDCPNYNRYKYGLEGLNSYMSRAGAERIREQYPRREVVYLLGERDNDPDARYLDKSCPAMLQGTNRLDRGLAYHRYLRENYGPHALEWHSEAVVPGVGHSASRMFNAEEGLEALFDRRSPAPLPGRPGGS